jgi:diguanylate cyclase (GGDEF)-like protein/PAS domain S-box-containing protein
VKQDEHTITSRRFPAFRVACACGLLLALIGWRWHQYTAQHPMAATNQIPNGMILLGFGTLTGLAAGFGVYLRAQRQRQLLSARHSATLHAMEQERDQMRDIVRGAATRVTEEQEHTQTILSALGQGLIGVDKQGNVQFLNAAAERLLGWTETELLGTPLHTHIHPQWDQTALCEPETCPLLVALQTHEAHREEQAVFVCRDSRHLPVAYICTPMLRSGLCTGGLVVFDDISERLAAARSLDEYARQVAEQNRQLQDYCAELTATQAELETHTRALTETNAQFAAANALLETLATTDGMTGLANHRVFQERLRAIWSVEESSKKLMPLSVLLIDVDNFKQYNDTYGHPAGDEVLRSIAQLMMDHVRDTDLVARYGGEEFAILLPHIEAQEAYRIAERLRAAVEAHVFPNRGVTVTISIGFATLENTQAIASGLETPDRVIAAADRALYQAKQTGRNRVCAILPGDDNILKAA